jgi:hypothetical protein
VLAQIWEAELWQITNIKQVLKKEIIMILERLEQTMSIPVGTNPVKVRAIQKHLMGILETKLKTPFVWQAYAYAALQAGGVASRKKIKRRQKLAKMIAVCAEFLGEDNPLATFSEGWEQENIFIGPDASSDAKASGSKWAHVRGMLADAKLVSYCEQQMM